MSIPIISPSLNFANSIVGTPEPQPMSRIFGLSSLGSIWNAFRVYLFRRSLKWSFISASRSLDKVSAHIHIRSLFFWSTARKPFWDFFLIFNIRVAKYPYKILLFISSHLIKKDGVANPRDKRNKRH